MGCILAIRREYRVDYIDGIVGDMLRPTDGPGDSILVEAVVARPGIYEYTNRDGSTRRELVLPENLHRKDDLSTLARAVVTVDHPPEMVTPGNVKQYMHGDADGEVTIGRNGFIRVKMAIRTEEAKNALRDGMDKTSPGYFAVVDETAGEHPVYGKYDAIQVRRDYNHIALCSNPRGGDSMAVRIDSNDVRVLSGGPAEEVRVDKDEMKADMEMEAKKADMDMEEDKAKADMDMEAEKADMDHGKEKADEEHDEKKADMEHDEEDKEDSYMSMKDAKDMMAEMRDAIMAEMKDMLAKYDEMMEKMQKDAPEDEMAEEEASEEKSEEAAEEEPAAEDDVEESDEEEAAEEKEDMGEHEKRDSTGVPTNPVRLDALTKRIDAVAAAYGVGYSATTPLAVRARAVVGKLHPDVKFDTDADYIAAAQVLPTEAPVSSPTRSEAVSPDAYFTIPSPYGPNRGH